MNNSKVECFAYNKKVIGSNPISSTLFIWWNGRHNGLKIRFFFEYWFKSSNKYSNFAQLTMSSLFYEEFSPIFLAVLFSAVLSLLIIGASYSLAVQKPDSEKLSAYECGFDPYEDARNAFDVRFYVVAILFIVFDLEALFFFPWIVSVAHLKSIGFWVMIDFLMELLIGFVYAWKVGALEWE